MTGDERRAQIQLTNNKIEDLHALLSSKAKSFKDLVERCVVDGSISDASRALGNYNGLLHAGDEIEKFHRWFSSQFEADLKE